MRPSDHDAVLCKELYASLYTIQVSDCMLPMQSMVSHHLGITGVPAHSACNGRGSVHRYYHRLLRRYGSIMGSFVLLNQTYDDQTV
jgi:hypothetical protein